MRKGDGVEEVVVVVVGKLSGEKQLREARELKMAVTLADYQLIMGLGVLLQGVSLRTEEPVSNLRKQYKIHEPDHSKSATILKIFNGMNLYQEVHMMRSFRFHSSRNQERKNHDLRQEEEPLELQVEYLMLHIQQHHDNKSSGKEKRKGKKKKTSANNSV